MPYSNGKVILDEGVDWPEGSRSEVRLVSTPRPLEQAPEGVRQVFFDALNAGEGLADAFWPISKPETELWEKWFDSTEPLAISDEEYDRMEQERIKRKEEQKELTR